MRLVTKICGILALLTGILIIAGNLFDISPGPAFGPKASGGCMISFSCLVLSGIVLLANARNQKKFKPVYYAGSVTLLAISIFALVFIFGYHSNDRTANLTIYTYINFLVLSLCFLLSNKKIGDHLITLWLAGAVFFFDLFVVFIYLFNAFKEINDADRVVLYTTIGSIATCLGFISSHSESRLVKTFMNKSSGGKILRMVLVPLFIILPFLSFLRVLGENAGYYSAGFGTAIMATFLLLVCTLLTINLCFRIDAAQARLVSGETMFRTMVENAREYAIFRLDKNGNVMTWNKGGQRIKGYSAKEIIGKHYSVFFTPEEIERGEPNHNLKMAEQQGYLETEGWRVRKDGSRFYADIVITAVYDPQGDLEGFIKVTRDVTAKREAQEKLNKLAALQVKHKELENFTYILTHDVLAPLRNISVISQWLAEDYADKVDEQGQEYIRLMNEKISLLGTMIDEVLEYIRAGKTEGEKTQVDTGKLVGDIIKMQSIPAKNLVLQIDGTLPVVYASKTALKQIFTNLVDNAIKHNDKEKVEVRVGCIDEGDHWKFYVKDNGPGIPQKDQDKVFEIFQTLKSKDETKSTGIGLATVKRNVTNEGGSIWIESEPDKGCTFFFTIKKS